MENEVGRVPAEPGSRPAGHAAVGVDGGSRFDPSRGFMLKPFTVEVAGFGAFAYPAATRGKALAEAWRDYIGCYNNATFADFLRIAKVRKGVGSERFGEPITVAGKPAFYVGQRGQYVRFVRPGETNCSNTHPSEVAAIAMETQRAETGNTDSVAKP